MAQLKKEFKKGLKNLKIIGNGLFNENTIWPEDEVWDKWE